jgi:antitoxin HicB
LTDTSAIVYNSGIKRREGDMKKYTIILEPDLEEGGYTVTVPALPGCITQGETVEQCIERAREAIAGYIEDLIANGEPVPEEIERPQMVTIDVAA